MSGDSDASGSSGLVISAPGAAPAPALGAGLPGMLAGRWFVAHTKSRNEKALSSELSRLSIFHYLPLTERTTRSPSNGRISRSLVPVFPGYLFFNGNEEERYLALRTNRVAKILEVPDQKQLLNELQRIDFLLRNTDAFEVTNRLMIGDWARILSGPLQGLEGVITQVSGRLRLWMNVTILGQSVNVEVGPEKVERIDPPPYAEAAGRARTRPE